jgi:hypothetical protein
LLAIVVVAKLTAVDNASRNQGPCFYTPQAVVGEFFFSGGVRLSVSVAASSRRFAAEDNWDKFIGLQGRKDEVK